MQMKLMRLKVFKFIMEEPKKHLPRPPDKDKPEDVARYDKETREWEEKDLLAKAEIAYRCAEFMQHELISMPHAYDVWQHLRKMYVESSTHNVSTMQQEWRQVSQRDRKLEPFFAELMFRLQGLKDIGKAPPDDEVVSHCMFHMHPSYRTLITAWTMAHGNKQPTLEELKVITIGQQNQDIAAERIAAHFNSTLNVATAQAVPVQSSSLAATADTICHSCRLPGHFARDCPNRPTSAAGNARGRSRDRGRERSRAAPAKCTTCGKRHPGECWHSRDRSTSSSSEERHRRRKEKQGKKGKLRARRKEREESSASAASATSDRSVHFAGLHVLSTALAMHAGTTPPCGDIPELQCWVTDSGSSVNITGFLSDLSDVQELPQAQQFPLKGIGQSAALVTHQGNVKTVVRTGEGKVRPFSFVCFFAPGLQRRLLSTIHHTHRPGPHGFTYIERDGTAALYRNKDTSPIPRPYLLHWPVPLQLSSQRRRGPGSAQCR